MEIIKIVTLSISGLLLLYGGISRISNPVKIYLKNSGIKLENEVNVLSEARGVSSVMLFSGIIMLLGTIVPELTITSFFVATLILLGFAFGRSLSIALDGKPNKLLVQGLIVEIVLGSANVFCLVTSLV
ncbi:MAG: DUF4345 domain-containing protein [Flavobacteriaceae bacterium]|nr:DUF4345 domain-containing protein [Flavobacteriaceae bacterium]